MTDKVLRMPMLKKHALEILRGEKIREYRPFSGHWARRLCVFGNPDNPSEATDVKHFDRVRFYSIGGKWFLECSVRGIIWYTVDEEFVREFGHEVEARPGDRLFIIRIGEVLETDLAA